MRNAIGHHVGLRCLDWEAAVPAAAQPLGARPLEGAGWMAAARRRSRIPAAARLEWLLIAVNQPSTGAPGALRGLMKFSVVSSARISRASGAPRAS
jgi:hypothetical protein